MAIGGRVNPGVGNTVGINIRFNSAIHILIGAATDKLKQGYQHAADQRNKKWNVVPG
jgi:hypothetical protein